jgi:hypothetical protein
MSALYKLPYEELVLPWLHLRRLFILHYLLL